MTLMLLNNDVTTAAGVVAELGPSLCTRGGAITPLIVHRFRSLNTLLHLWFGL